MTTVQLTLHTLSNGINAQLCFAAYNSAHLSLKFDKFDRFSSFSHWITCKSYSTADVPGSVVARPPKMTLIPGKRLMNLAHDCLNVCKPFWKLVKPISSSFLAPGLADTLCLNFWTPCRGHLSRPMGVTFPISLNETLKSQRMHRACDLILKNGWYQIFC